MIETVARLDFSQPDVNRRLVIATREVLECNGKGIRKFRNDLANLIARKRVGVERLNTWTLFWLCQKHISIYPERGSRGYTAFVDHVGEYQAKKWAEAHPEYLGMIQREDRAAA